MFRQLPVFDHRPDTLRALAETMLQEAHAQVPDGTFDENENPAKVPAGDTYLGQFIDHESPSTRSRSWSARTTRMRW